MSDDRVDDVFRALSDPSRRLLLDQMAETEGQTVGELCAHLSEMSRYGVMKHLGILESAGLVVTQWSGRTKHHYLNRVPIRELHDRWISQILAPGVTGLVALKHHIELQTEGETAMASAPDQSSLPVQSALPVHVHEIHIQCRPEDVWRALTEGDQTIQYFFGTRVESIWAVGAAIRYVYDGGPMHGDLAADGTVLAIEEPRLLDTTFHPRWDPESEAEGPCRTLWLIEPEAENVTRVRVEYYDIDPAGPQMDQFRAGIVAILSGLKTLLETGQPLYSDTSSE